MNKILIGCVLMSALSVLAQPEPPAAVGNGTITDEQAALKGNATAATNNSSLKSKGNTAAATDVYREPPVAQSQQATARPEGDDEQPSSPVARGKNGVGGRDGRNSRGKPPTTFQPGADFSVVIIGSGSPQYNPKRSGPSAAIQYRGHFILVDMGNGTQARLYEAGISLAQIDAFCITHHHLDHDEEFMPLLDKALVRGLPLQIVGTPGTVKLAKFTENFYADDIAYRIGNTGRKAQNIQKPAVREIQGGESFRLGDLQVRTVQVPHSIHTVAYRFDVGGQSIVISGDLAYSDKLIELARGADVLVIDSGGAIVRQGAETFGGRHPAAHASAEEVCTMAQKAGVKKLVLTHIAVPEVDETATINAIRKIYHGEVIVGHDLLQIAPAAH